MEKGRIVKSVAGHDKNSFYMVLKIEADRVFLADGKLRKLEKPKAKNVRHIRPTMDVAEPDAVKTDKRLRELLKPYNNAVKKTAANEEGGS